MPKLFGFGQRRLRFAFAQARDDSGNFRVAGLNLSLVVLIAVDGHAEREEMLRGVLVADTSNWKGAELAAAADVMVYASGTNISIVGAFARRPAVYLDDESVRARIAKQSGGDGSWFVAEFGGAYKAKSVNDLLSCIMAALSKPGRDELCRWQEAAFPLPDDWHTEDKIIRALEDLVDLVKVY